MSNLPRPARVYRPPVIAGERRRSAAGRGTTRRSTAGKEERGKAPAQKSTSRFAAGRKTKVKIEAAVQYQLEEKPKSAPEPEIKSRVKKRPAPKSRFSLKKPTLPNLPDLPDLPDLPARPPLPRIPYNVSLVNQIGGAIALIMMAVTLFLFGARFLQINEVVCIFDEQPCATELQEAFLVFIEQPLLFNDLSTQVRNLDLLENQLSSVRIEKNLPSLVTIHLVSAPILYQLQMDDQIKTMNTNLVLQNFTPQASVFQQTNPYPLIQVNYQPVRDYIKGAARVPAFYHQAWLDLIHGWEQSAFAHQITAIELAADEKLRLKTNDGLEFIFDQTDLHQSWQKYDYLWRNLSSDQLKSFREIELRFNSPVALPRADS